MKTNAEHLNECDVEQDLTNEVSQKVRSNEKENDVEEGYINLFHLNNSWQQQRKEEFKFSDSDEICFTKNISKSVNQLFIFLIRRRMNSREW